MTRLLPLLLLLGCSSAPETSKVVSNGLLGTWQEAGGPTVSLEVEQTYGREDGTVEEMLEGPRRAAVDAVGNLYLHDGERLVAFSPEAEVLWTITAEGEGPGELRRVRGLFLGDDDLLWVTNQAGTRLDRFDLEGALVDTRPLSDLDMTWGAAHGLLPDGTVVLSSNRPGDYGNRIHLAEDDTPLRTLDTLWVDQSSDEETPGAISVGSSMGVVREHVLLGLIQDYGYLALDASLDTAFVTARPDIPKRPPYGFLRNGNPAVIMLGSHFDPLALADGRWLGGGSWAVDVENIADWAADLFSPDAPSIEYDRSLDLYDARGTLLYTWSDSDLDAAGIQTVLASDGVDRIFVRTSDPVPTVARLRLVISG